MYKHFKFIAILMISEIIAMLITILLLSQQTASANTNIIKISVKPSETMYENIYGENIKWINSKDDVKKSKDGVKKRYAKISVKHNEKLKKEIEEEEARNNIEKKQSINSMLKILCFFGCFLIFSLLMAINVSFLTPFDFLNVKNN